MCKPWQALGAILLLIVLARCVTAQTHPYAEADAVISDFEPEIGAPIRLNGASATIAPGDAAQGRQYLQLQPGTDAAGRAYVRLPLPQAARFPSHDRLTAELRAPQAPQSVKLSWIALDEAGHPLFVHPFELAPGERWVRVEAPLRTWRWDARRLGDWDEVRELALRIDSPGAGRLDVDDIRLRGQRDPDSHISWLLDTAFGAEAPRKVVMRDRLLVATDAVDAFSEQDLRRLLEDMVRTRAFIRRIFGDVVRPTDDIGAPAALLVFASDQRRGEFFDRLEREWRATIARSSSQGYTIQDIATATYDPRLGVRRPVYLHESVHAVVARDLRLLTGHAPHSPLQEGIATYLQICAHPQSIERRAYVQAFARPLDPSGKGLFQPLEQLFAQRAATRHYAQLGSLVAYLVEHDLELLRELAQGLSRGESASGVLARRGTTWEALQDAWLAWGRRRFGDNPDHDERAIFDPPPEFR